jgi:hypothetical protein
MGKAMKNLRHVGFGEHAQSQRACTQSPSATAGSLSWGYPGSAVVVGKNGVQWGSRPTPRLMWSIGGNCATSCGGDLVWFMAPQRIVEPHTKPPVSAATYKTDLQAKKRKKQKSKTASTVKEAPSHTGQLQVRKYSSLQHVQI